MGKNFHHAVEYTLTAAINIFRCKDVVCISPFYTYTYRIAFQYFKIIKTNSKVEIYIKRAFF
jgi:hypothetical protein